MYEDFELGACLTIINVHILIGEKNTTVQMLRKAGETKVVENLVDDNEKITETLTKLRNLSDRLTVLREKTVTELVEKTKQCDIVKSRLDDAEKRVDVITILS